MSAAEISQAKRDAERARRRLAATASELQQRLKPGSLANHAWEGVKDRGGELADGAVVAVRSRPMIVSAALAAFTLFLARRPLASAATRLFSGDEEEDEELVTTRLDGGDTQYDLTAPVAERKESEGASA